MFLVAVQGNRDCFTLLPDCYVLLDASRRMASVFVSNQSFNR